MFPQTEDKTIMSLARLQSNNDFALVVEWLNTMLSNQDVQNRVLTDHRLQQGQGTAQVLAHILEQSEKSKEVAERIKTINIPR